MALSSHKIPSSQIRARASFRLGDLNEEEPNLEAPRSFWHADPIAVTAWFLAAALSFAVLLLCLLSLAEPALAPVALLTGGSSESAPLVHFVIAVGAGLAAVLCLAVPLSAYRRFRRLSEVTEVIEPDSDGFGELASAGDFARGGSSRPASSDLNMARPRMPR